MEGLQAAGRKYFDRLNAGMVRPDDGAFHDGVPLTGEAHAWHETQLHLQRHFGKLRDAPAPPADSGGLRDSDTNALSDFFVQDAAGNLIASIYLAANLVEMGSEPSRWCESPARGRSRT